MKTIEIVNSGMTVSQNKSIPFALRKNGDHKYLLQHRKRKRNES